MKIKTRKDRKPQVYLEDLPVGTMFTKDDFPGKVFLVVAEHFEGNKCLVCLNENTVITSEKTAFAGFPDSSAVRIVEGEVVLED